MIVCVRLLLYETQKDWMNPREYAYIPLNSSYTAATNEVLAFDAKRPVERLLVHTAWKVFFGRSMAIRGRAAFLLIFQKDPLSRNRSPTRNDFPPNPKSQLFQ